MSDIIDQELAQKLLVAGSWLLILIGLVKLIIFLIGEWIPNAYSRFKSEKAQRFFTGKANRLIFGLGGLLTVLLGVVFLGLTRLVAFLHTLAP